MALAMLFGTVFFGQVFGYFMHEEAPMLQSPDVAYWVAAGLLAVTLVMYLIAVPEARRAIKRET